MGSISSAGPRSRLCGPPGPTAQLLAETIVSVEHTLGVGAQEDNREIDHAEREVWLELLAACPDRLEREWRIEQARGTVAHAGPPVCRQAAERLRRTASAMKDAAAERGGAEAHDMRRCAERWLGVVERLERLGDAASGL
jgi:hypothetical protein